MKKIKSGFSMIELLFVMAVMGILTGMAVKDQSSKIAADLHVKVEAELADCKTITEKIIARSYPAGIIDFTASAANYMYVDTVDSLDFKYVVSNKVNLKQVQIFDNSTSDYTSYGIILDTSNYYRVDTNGNHITTFSKPCYVYNNLTDSKGYWTTKCTPTLLGWDFQN